MTPLCYIETLGREGRSVWAVLPFGTASDPGEPMATAGMLVKIHDSFMFLF